MTIRRRIAAAALLVTFALVTLGATKKPVSVITPAPAAGNACFTADVDSANLNTANGQTLKCNASTLLWELVPSIGGTSACAIGFIQVANASGGFTCDPALSVSNSVLYTPAQVVGADNASTVGSFGNVVTIGGNSALTIPMTPSKAGNTGFTDCDNTTAQKICLFEDGVKAFQITSTPGIVMNQFLQSDDDGTVGDYQLNPEARFTPEASNPTCSAGKYMVYVKNAATVFSKCENGVETQLDTGGGGGGGGFDAIGTGTNTTATMTVGTGGALTTSGSGIIRANQMDLTAATLTNNLPVANLPGNATSGLCLISNGTSVATPPSYQACSGATSTNFSSLVGSTNTNQALVVGNSSVLSATGSGIIRATQFVNAASVTQGADLGTSEVQGVLPLTQLPDDATAGLCLLSGGGGSDPTWTTCPSSPLSGTNTWTGVNTFTSQLNQSLAAGQQGMNWGGETWTGAQNHSFLVWTGTANTSSNMDIFQFNFTNTASASGTNLFNWKSGSGGATSLLKLGATGTLTHAVNAANTAGSVESGYSLTGTDATSAYSWTGTVNTSGNPIIFNYVLTDTVHGATTRVFDWKTAGAGSSMFTLRPTGQTEHTAVYAAGMSSIGSYYDVTDDGAENWVGANVVGGVYIDEFLTNTGAAAGQFVGFMSRQHNKGAYTQMINGKFETTVPNGTQTVTSYLNVTSSYVTDAASGTIGDLTLFHASASDDFGSGASTITELNGLHVDDTNPDGTSWGGGVTVDDAWGVRVDDLPAAGALITNWRAGSFAGPTGVGKDYDLYWWNTDTDAASAALAGLRWNSSTSALETRTSGTLRESVSSTLRTEAVGIAQAVNASLASASTISADGINVAFITGTTTITTINTCDSANRGRELTLVWAASATADVTDGSNLKLAGNYTTAVEFSTLKLLCNGSSWLELSRSVN